VATGATFEISTGICACAEGYAVKDGECKKDSNKAAPVIISIVSVLVVAGVVVGVLFYLKAKKPMGGKGE